MPVRTRSAHARARAGHTRETQQAAHAANTHDPRRVKMVSDTTVESMKKQAEQAEQARQAFTGLFTAAQEDTKAIVRNGNATSVDQRHFQFARVILESRHSWARTPRGNKAATLAVWPVLDPDPLIMPDRKALQPLTHERWTEVAYPAIKAAMDVLGLETSGNPAKSGQIRVTGLSKDGAKTERKAFTLTLIA